MHGSDKTPQQLQGWRGGPPARCVLACLPPQALLAVEMEGVPDTAGMNTGCRSNRSLFRLGTLGKKKGGGEAERGAKDEGVQSLGRRRRGGAYLAADSEEGKSSGV